MGQRRLPSCSMWLPLLGLLTLLAADAGAQSSQAFPCIADPNGHDFSAFREARIDHMHAGGNNGEVAAWTHWVRPQGVSFCRVDGTLRSGSPFRQTTVHGLGVLEGIRPTMESSIDIDCRSAGGPFGSCQPLPLPDPWEFCGDAIVQSESGEECDDGNFNSGDGCWESCSRGGSCPAPTAIKTIDFDTGGQADAMFDNFTIGTDDFQQGCITEDAMIGTQHESGAWCHICALSEINAVPAQNRLVTPKPIDAGKVVFLNQGRNPGGGSHVEILNYVFDPATLKTEIRRFVALDPADLTTTVLIERIPPDEYTSFDSLKTAVTSLLAIPLPTSGPSPLLAMSAAAATTSTPACDSDYSADPVAQAIYDSLEVPVAVPALSPHALLVLALGVLLAVRITR